MDELDFTMPAGAHFAKLFNTALGQLLITLEPNDSGNASYVFRMWTADGFAKGRVGIDGARSVGGSNMMADAFHEIDDGEKALAAFTLLMAGDT